MARGRGELLEDVEYHWNDGRDDPGAESDDGTDTGANANSNKGGNVISLLSKMDARKKYRILRSHFWADQEASSVWRVQATSDFGFVAGEQLSTDDKALLDAQQRPHIVFNRVQTILKAVAGMQINGRSEIKFLPRNNQDTEVNEILTAASKWMADGCDAEDEQSAAFQDCCVCGMGWCLSDDAMVRLPNTHFATTRLYSGDVIKIDLENGQQLTGTPNHPVLTNHGWKRLYDLQEGDNLVSAAFMERVKGLPVEQFDKVETRLKDKVDAFSAGREALWFATAPDDFYADGAGSEVHVVYADRLLLDKVRKAALPHHGDQSQFSGRNLLSKVSAFFSRHRLVHRSVYAAIRQAALDAIHLPRAHLTPHFHGAESVACSVQSHSDGLRIDPNALRNLNGRQVFFEVEPSQFLNAGAGSRTATPRAQRMAGAAQSTRDAGLRYSNLIGDFFDWKPLLEVEARKLSSGDAGSAQFMTRVKGRIVSAVENFAVHDVGTSLGFFVAGDIITSNTESRFTYDDSADGMYVEESVDPREMLWDRTARKKNITDARRMTRIRKMPLSDAMQMFPGKKRYQLDAEWAHGNDVDRAEKSIEQKRIRDGEDSYTEFDDKNEVTLVCTEWWEREPYWRIADTTTNTLMDVTEEQYHKLKERFAALGMNLEGVRMTRKCYYRAWLGNEYLGGGKAPCGNRFSWACITGEYDKQKRFFYGLVRVMRDPQMWANKFMSQIMQIMNSTAKGGIMAEMSAFEDQEEAEETYAMPESITWMADGALSGTKPKVIPKPGQGDASAYVNLLQLAISSIKDVTGINLELLGQQDQNQPGILEHMRKQAGMTVLATQFDSFRKFLKIVGDKRLYYIQNRMSDGRLIRVVGDEYTRAVPLAKDKTTGEYDTIVDDAPTSPNQKEANWAIMQPMLAVFKEQLMGNPQVLIMVLRYSPLPSALVEAIAKVINQAANDPQKQQEAEMMKKAAMDHLIATTNKEQSIAEANNAKAGTSQATAIYDIAMARNMMADNERQTEKHAVELAEAQTKQITAVAGARKSMAEIEHVRARTAREHVGIIADQTKSAAEILRARTEALMASRSHAREDATAAHGMHMERQRGAIEHMNAQAGMLSAVGGFHRDVASAFKARKDAVRPNPKPAAKK